MNLRNRVHALYNDDPVPDIPAVNASAAAEEEEREDDGSDEERAPGHELEGRGHS
jgi:hypothetical protein